MRRFAPATLLVIVSLIAAPARAPARAQAPRQERALTRPENWGLTFGIEGISGSYHPSLNQPYAFQTTGRGPVLNAGVVWLRHFLLGGEIGSVFFAGDDNFTISNSIGTGTFRAQTTNSMVRSLYVGVTTSPMGRSKRMGRKWWLGVLGGSSKWGGERRMPGCLPCGTVDHIPMLSGRFIEPFATFGGGDHEGGGGLRLGYRKYYEGYRWVQSAVTFGLFFDFLKL